MLLTNLIVSENNTSETLSHVQIQFHIFDLMAEQLFIKKKSFKTVKSKQTV